MSAEPLDSRPPVTGGRGPGDELARIETGLESLRGFYGPVASADALAALGVRVLVWRESIGLTAADVASACRVLMRPTVAAGIRYPSDLLAEFATAVANAVRDRTGREEWAARRQEAAALTEGRAKVRAIAEGVTDGLKK